MKKTIAYIDGGNLYFGLLRRRPSCKWLDLRSFTNKLLDETHELVAIKYFTARVKTYPYDAAAVERQNVYLQAVKAHGGIEIIEGYYNKNKIWIPAIDPSCRDCTSSTNGYVHVMKMEEKRSDVNIVTEMLRDSYTNAIDSIMLIMRGRDRHRAAPMAARLISFAIPSTQYPFIPFLRGGFASPPKPIFRTRLKAAAS